MKGYATYCDDCEETVSLTEDGYCQECGKHADNIKDTEWAWRMRWCKENEVSPSNAHFWDKSKKAYNEKN